MSNNLEQNRSIFDTGTFMDLPDMLNAREERFHIQKTLLSQFLNDGNGSLLVMTMAIPGPIKANAELNQAFDEMQEYVSQQLDKQQIIQKLKREKDTGLEYFVLSHLSPREMKERMVEIEESHPLGRLFDLDVLFLNDENEVEGTSRTQLGLPVRRCFICDRPAKECGRSRRHSVEELQNEISTRILQYFNE